MIFSVWIRGDMLVPWDQWFGNYWKRNRPPPFTFFWFSTRYFAQTPIKVVIRRKRTGSPIQNFCPIQNSLRFFSKEILKKIVFFRKIEKFEIFGFFRFFSFFFDFLKDFLWKKCWTKKIFFVSAKIFSSQRRNIFKST